MRKISPRRQRFLFLLRLSCFRIKRITYEILSQNLFHHVAAIVPSPCLLTPASSTLSAEYGLRFAVILVLVTQQVNTTNVPIIGHTHFIVPKTKRLGMPYRLLTHRFWKPPAVRHFIKILRGALSHVHQKHAKISLLRAKAQLFRPTSNTVVTLFAATVQVNSDVINRHTHQNKLLS